MPNTRWTISKGERPKLRIAVAVLLSVIPTEHEAEERQFVRVCRQLAWLRMLELGENRPADCLLAHHVAIEFTASQPFFARNLCYRRHLSPSQQVDFVQDLGTSIP